MTRSFTLRVPSARQLILAVAGLGLALVVVLVGVRLGASLLSPSPIMGLAGQGELQQVQLLGGAVYLGRIVDNDGSTVRLARPAIVRQEQAPAPSGAQGPRIVVQSLATDPYAIAGDILIPLDSVALIGVVQPSSSLGRAYGEAMGLSPAPAGSGAP